MNQEQYERMKNGKGFIAALDQSGGSSAKTLKRYGIAEEEYNGDEEMFNLIHEMRTRVIKSSTFTAEHILGVILFENTMNRKIDDEYSADYLWNKKGIVPFLKVDKGLMDLEDGVQLMKPINNLEELLDQAVERNVFGTKMRSVVKEANLEGIKKIVDQQFEVGEIIAKKGLVPILEPEVDINCPEKEECEKMLKEEMKKHLENWDNNLKIMFKLTIPTVENFYKDIMEYPCVVRVVALSGGYSQEKSNELLAKNNGLIASFSRALLEELKADQSEEEFDNALNKAIVGIYNASIT